MGYDIGPRIKITGEKEFNDQINKINNSLKEYGSELKAVSAKFAENENSQEALIAKNKVLQKQYDTQQQKLKVYQTQLDKQKKSLKEQEQEITKLTAEYGENSKEVLKAQNAYKNTETNISKLSTSINETTAYTNKLSNDINKNTRYLNEMDNGLRDASTGMSKLEKSSKDLATGLNDADDKLGEISNKISAGIFLEAADQLSSVGDAVSNFGSKALGSFTELEDATKKTNGYFNETGEAAKINGDLIKKIYEDGLGDSLDSVAEAVIKVKKNIKNLNDQDLYDITEQAIILEDTFGVDMNETLRGADSLIKHFGLSAKDAMDYIVKGTQEGLDWTDELGDNISEYAGNFVQAGYSAKDYFQLLKNGADGGAYNLDKVNDSINEITNRLADGTIEKNLDIFSSGTEKLFKKWQKGGATQKEVIDSIVSDIASCTNEQDALTMAATAFGTMGEDANLNVVKSLTTLGDSFNDVSDTAANMNNNTTTESQKLEGNIRKIDDAFSDVGEVLAKLANDILPPVADAISAIGEFFGELPEPIQIFIVAVGGIIIALMSLSPLLMSIASLMTIFGGSGAAAAAGASAAGTAAGGASIGFGALSTSLLPIIGIVLGIIAAITTIILVIKNWDAIVQWFGDQWANFTAALSDVWESFSVWFNEKLDGLINFFSKAAEDIGSSVDDVVNFFGALPGRLKTWLDDTIDSVAAWGQKMYSKAVQAASDTIDGITGFFTSLPSMAIEWGSDMIDGFVDGIKGMIGSVTDAVSDVADTVFGWLHFSRPDKGPLREYEKWMPDMMKGLSKGIHDNRWRVEDEVSSLANAMTFAMTPDIEASAKTQYSNEIVLNVTNNMDGRVISKSTERIITSRQNTRRIARGY